MDNKSEKNDINVKNNEENINEETIIKIEHLCKNYKMFNKKSWCIVFF